MRPGRSGSGPTGGGDNVASRQLGADRGKNTSITRHLGIRNDPDASLNCYSGEAEVFGTGEAAGFSDE